MSATPLAAQVEPAALVVEDIADDANGVNTQGETGVGTLDVPTGDASRDEADLLSTRLEAVWETRPDGSQVRTGTTVQIIISGTFDETVQFLVNGDVSGCDGLLVGHDPAPLPGDSPTSVSVNCDQQRTTVALAPPVVEGSTMTITVPDEALAEALVAPATLSRIWIRSQNAVGPALHYDTAAAGGGEFEIRSAPIDPPAVDPPAVTGPRRLAGEGREGTAAAIAGATFAEGARTVLLATSAAYADALAAAPLAGALKAPILLTPPDRVADDVAAELRRLSPQRVVLLGGTDALSEQVADDVRALGVDRVDRIAGASRFETAALVAAAVLEQSSTTTAYVVEGQDADPARGWPDAVALSGLAAATQAPVLLVTTDDVPTVTADLLGEGDIRAAVIVGGTAAVSAAVAAEIADLVTDVDRIAGDTRYETSTAVARRTAELAHPILGATWFATGRDWPDALAAGPAAARSGAVLHLVDGHDVEGSPSALAWLEGTCGDVTVVGGSAALTNPVLAALGRARDCT